MCFGTFQHVSTGHCKRSASTSLCDFGGLYQHLPPVLMIHGYKREWMGVANIFLQRCRLWFQFQFDLFKRKPPLRIIFCCHPWTGPPSQFIHITSCLPMFQTRQSLFPTETRAEWIYVHLLRTTIIACSLIFCSDLHQEVKIHQHVIHGQGLASKVSHSIDCLFCQT